MRTQQFISNTRNGRVWQGGEGVGTNQDAAQLKLTRLNSSNFPPSGRIPGMSPLRPGSRYRQHLCTSAPEFAEAELGVRFRPGPSSTCFKYILNVADPS